MAKTKAKSQPSLLDQLRTAAFAVTVGSAVTYGLLVAFESVTSSSTLWIEYLNGILIEVTVIGGVSMGLLYAFYKVSKRK